MNEFKLKVIINTYSSAKAPPLIFNVPECKNCSPKTSVVNVGRICKYPSSQNEFERLFVYH